MMTTADGDGKLAPMKFHKPERVAASLVLTRVYARGTFSRRQCFPQATRDHQVPSIGRVGDVASVALHSHGCPACPHTGSGPALSGSPNVNVNSRGALRVGDPGVQAVCCGPNNWTAALGSTSVFINGKPAHRLGDAISHAFINTGWLTTGSPDVTVGG